MEIYLIERLLSHIQNILYKYPRYYTSIELCKNLWNTDEQTLEKSRENQGIIDRSVTQHDAGALAKEVQGNLGDQQAKENQDQGAIQALFSFTSSQVCTVLGTPFEISNQGMIGRVLLCWTP